MIYISQEQLDQVEYLIQQSIQGNHILFDPKDIRDVFQKTAHHTSDDLSDSEAYEVEHHIEKLILQPTLAQKKAYLDQLDTRTFKKLIRTYFNIVENNLIENSEVKH